MDDVDNPNDANDTIDSGKAKGFGKLPKHLEAIQ
jgi:hypothetical protein